MHTYMHVYTLTHIHKYKERERTKQKSKRLLFLISVNVEIVNKNLQAKFKNTLRPYIMTMVFFFQGHKIGPILQMNKCNAPLIDLRTEIT